MTEDLRYRDMFRYDPERDPEAPTHEYTFVCVGGATARVQSLLDQGWEPVPDCVPVVNPKTGQTYVFLRRPK